MNTEISTKSKRGGKRQNAGIKKGFQYQSTLEKKSVLSEIQQRTMRHASKLWNAQYQKAVGSMMIYRRDVTVNKKGQEKVEYVHITDPSEIQDFLNEHDGKNGVTNDNYYFITEVPPDNKAIDSILDRTFGKAQQSIEIETTSNTPILQFITILMTEHKWSKEKAIEAAKLTYGEIGEIGEIDV